MNIIKKLFKLLWLILLSLLVFYMLLTSWILWRKYLTLCGTKSSRLHWYMSVLESEINTLNSVYNEYNNVQLKENICYTLFNHYILNKDKWTEMPDCEIWLYEAKLLKKWKKCYVYKLKVKDIFSKEQYKYINFYKKFILWNYDIWKRCGEKDYEKCNIYITEKWILDYNNNYKCE